MILSDLRTTLQNNLTSTADNQTLFFYTLHDWLAHLTDARSLLPEFSMSLGGQILYLARDESLLMQRWVRSTVCKPISVPLLMYRHLILKSVFDVDILNKTNDPQFHLTLATTYYTQVRFSLLESDKLWDRLDTAPVLINALRANQPVIRDKIKGLANREDETIYRLDRDHALLSSVTLLYTLYAIQAILSYEHAVRPNAQVKAVSHSLQQAIAHIKGVFFHVSY